MSKRGSLLATAAPAAATSPAIAPAAVVDPLAAIEPAINAAAARAAAERTADSAAAVEVPPVPSAPVVADLGTPATVLPEPALPTPPEAPMPLVTASPPIAAEPSVMDVIDAGKAEAGQLLGQVGFDVGAGTADRGGPRFAEAGQPMIAIEPTRPSAATVAAEAATTPLPPPLGGEGIRDITVVEVTGPERGRYRAGLAFGATPRRFPPVAADRCAARGDRCRSAADGRLPHDRRRRSGVAGGLTPAVPYTTLTALQRRFGAAMLVQLTDRADVPTGVVDPDVVDQELANTDAVIDAALSVRYQLPLVATPVAVADLALSIAIYKLHRFEPDPKVKADYEQALRDLRDLANGTKKLDVAGVEPPMADGPGVVFADRPRDFSPDNLRGFI